MGSVPEWETQHGLGEDEAWGIKDLASAARELRHEYPMHPAKLILAAVQTAAHIICPSSGRARFLQIAREVLRENQPLRSAAE